MKTNHILAILALIAGMTAAFTKHSENNKLYPNWKYQKERVDGKKYNFISASHLANQLYSKDPNIVLFDTRTWKAFEHYHIPQALAYDPGMGSKAASTSGKIVLYGEPDDEGLYDLARELPGRVYILKGGMDAWYSLVLFPDFVSFSIRNSDQLDHILSRSGFFGGMPQNSQLLNINVRESRYREGC